MDGAADNGGDEVINWISFALRVGLGALFLYAGLVKASNSQQFALGLIPFTFLPAHSTGMIAILIAWSEVVAGVLILLPRINVIGSLMIGSLSGLFVVVLSWALWNGIVIPCSCFGDGSTPSQEAMLLAILRDVFLLAGAVAAFLIEWRAGRRIPPCASMLG